MAAKRNDTARAKALEQYGDRARQQHVTPLWEFFKDWFRGDPTIAAVPYLWRYDALRPLLTEAAGLISAEGAERRVLALENPGLRGERLVTDALYAGLQLIVPGEVAPSHRHSAAALRFILEGRGAYTAVAGERAYMEPGDFIVTPSWTFHEHGNEGDGPTIWLDVLDVPLIRFLGAGFSEHYAGGRYPERAPPGDSRARYGANLRPAGYARKSGASPVFSYPYADARAVLEKLRGHGEWDPCHGLKMEYIDPTTGGPAIPTLSTFLQLVPAGFRTAPYRSTSGSVYSVVEGRGRAIFGERGEPAELAFEPRDAFAAPGWQTLAIEAHSDVVLFSASDEAVQRMLGVWREQRGGAASLPRSG
jgi:gentisate 1,2-dioxygenase